MTKSLTAFVITGIILATLAGLGVWYFVFNSQHKLNQAEEYIREYKFAKALSLLDTLSNSKDLNLNELRFYALVKASRFDLAKEEIDNVKEFSKDFRKKFSKVLEILNSNNETELLNKLILKSHKLDLNSEFFIKLSQSRKTAQEEMTVLESGLKYLRSIQNQYRQKKKINKAKEVNVKEIENFILKRSIENANLKLSEKKYNKALNILLRAEKLKVTKNDYLTDSYFYMLAEAYKHTGDPDKARDYLQKSAKLGNEKAKSQLKILN